MAKPNVEDRPENYEYRETPEQIASSISDMFAMGGSPNFDPEDKDEPEKPEPVSVLDRLMERPKGETVERTEPVEEPVEEPVDEPVEEPVVEEEEPDDRLETEPELDSEPDEEEEEAPEEPEDEEVFSPEAAELALLKMQNQELLERMKKLETPAQKPEAKPEARQEAREEYKVDPATLPHYNMVIPGEYMDALLSEDPALAKQGLEALFNTVAGIVQQRTLHEARNLVRSIVEEQIPVVNQKQEKVQQTYAAIRKDFFSAYPGYDNEKIHPLIGQVVGSLSKELGVTEWTPEFRNKVGDRVRVMLGGYDGKAGKARAKEPAPLRKGTTKPGPKPGRKPARLLKPGSRPAAKKSGNAIADDLDAMFSTDFDRRL